MTFPQNAYQEKAQDSGVLKREKLDKTKENKIKYQQIFLQYVQYGVLMGQEKDKNCIVNEWIILNLKLLCSKVLGSR